MSWRGLVLCGFALAAASAGPGCSPRAPQLSRRAALTCAAGEPGFSRAQPLLQRYCVTCHSADGDAGEEHDFERPELLRAQRRQISARLRAHSMPPRGSPQPDAVETALLAHWADCGATQD
jgi:uncharacterized membrane protein